MKQTLDEILIGKTIKEIFPVQGNWEAEEGYQYTRLPVSEYETQEETEVITKNDAFFCFLFTDGMYILSGKGELFALCEVRPGVYTFLYDEDE